MSIYPDYFVGDAKLQSVKELSNELSIENDITTNYTHKNNELISRWTYTRNFRQGHKIIFYDSIYGKDNVNGSAENFYQEYLDKKKLNENNLNFYIHSADIAIDKGLPDIAMRIILNLSEIFSDDPIFNWTIAHWLNKSGFNELAANYFKDLQSIILYNEKHNSVDMAIALANSGKYQEAADALYKYLNDMFYDHSINLFQYLIEFNKVVKKANGNIDISKFDSVLIKDYSFGLEISMDYSNNNVGLVIVEPDNEICEEGETPTHSGCIRTSHSNTEEYFVRKPVKGKYRIILFNKYPGSQWEDNSTTISLVVTLNQGTPQEERKELLLNIKHDFEFLEVGEINIE